MRRHLLALAVVLAGLTPPAIVPAHAQAPPAVPALPDTERRTSYSISGTNCACSVGFQLYGSGNDVDAWIEVWINGVRYLSTDVSHGWSLSSATGSLATIPRPITNALLTFNAVQTGTVQIVGAERPRQLAQFAENRGVAARDLNQALTDIVAQNRETWDRTNDINGRALRVAPGETLTTMPNQSTRGSGVLGFDGSGNPTILNPSLGLGNVLGPNSSVDGHVVVFNGASGKLIKDGGGAVGNVSGPGSSTSGNIPQWNNASGTLLSDSAISLNTATAKAYPCTPAMDGTCTVPLVQSPLVSGHVVAPLDQNVVFTGNNVYPFGVFSSNPLVNGVNVALTNSSAGRTHALRFTSAFLSGSPITVSFVDTNSTDATSAVGLCTAINANTTLHSASTSLPVICDPITGNGTMNVQWSITLSDLAIADVSSGGATITVPSITASSRALDFAVMNFGRYISGYAGQNGDSPVCLELWGQNSAGGLSGEALMCSAISDATNFTADLTLTTAVNFVGKTQLGLKTGVAVYDNTNSLPTGGYKGQGTLNVSGSAGGYYVSGNLLADGTGIIAPSGTINGGTGAASGLNVKTTTNGAPSGDFLAFWTGIGGTLTNSWRLTGGEWQPQTNNAYDLGDATHAARNVYTRNLIVPGATSGTPTIVAQATAGTPTLTLPTGTGTFAVTAAGPLALDAGTGNLTCATCATTAGASIPSVVQGDVLYASAANTLSALNKNTTATRYLANTGTSNNPAWAQVDLTNGVTGALPGVNGGTGLSTAAVGDLIYASATTPTWSRLAAVATGQVLISQGVNTAPVWSASPALTSATFTSANNFNTVTLRSGASNAYVGLSLGRTTNEGYYLITGANDQFINGSLAGDFEIFAVGNLWFSANGNAVKFDTAGIFTTPADIIATGNFKTNQAAKTLVLKQGANGTVGTFVCTSGGTITISNTNIAITDAIIISLNTAGGTISTPPATKAITAATSFQVLCATNDTATYNYAIIKNAAWLLRRDLAPAANDNFPAFMENAA